MEEKKEKQEEEILTKEKINGGEKVNAQELLKDAEKIREILLKNDPDRFKENEGR